MARAIRVFIWSFGGTFLSFFGGGEIAPGYIPDMDVLHRAFSAAIFSGVIALVSLFMNFAEDKTNIPLPTRSLKAASNKKS